MRGVQDASALLAFLNNEPGSGVVDQLLADAVMGSLNWAEVVQKAISAGVEVDGLLSDLKALGLSVVPILPADGDKVGRLWETRKTGLSLGNSACLSLRLRLGLTAVTCDRAWAGVDLPIQVQVVR